VNGEKREKRLDQHPEKEKENRRESLVMDNQQKT